MKKILFAVAFLSVSIAHGQDTLKLSLSEVIAFSLSNNKNIQAGELNTQLNNFRTKELKSALYPSISGNASLTHYLDVPKQYVAANALSPSAPSDQYIGLKLLLPNSTAAGVSLNWTIYNQAIYSALKIVAAQNQLSNVQFEKDRRELAFTVSQLYYGIMLLQKQLDNLIKVSANTGRLIGILQSNYDNGLIKKSELEKVQVSKVNISSQIAGLTAAIETQNNLLKLFMGVPAAGNILLTEPVFETMITAVPDSVTTVENSPDIQIIRTQIQLSKLERKSILATNIPTVGLIYQYSYNTVSPKFSKVLNTSFTYPQQFIGVNLAVPIFEGNRKEFRLKQNTIKSRQLDLESQFISERVNTDITNALLRYNSSLKTASSNEANVKLALRIYSETIAEYRQGVIPLNEVLTSENTLQQALTEYFNSVSTTLLALLDYKKATNTILKN